MTYLDILNLAGGLGLFLFGMNIMGQALKIMAGSKLRSLLNRFTSNRFSALLLGLGFSAVIQSSSATTAMVVGFVNAGVMEVQNTVGIILGANIGTTVTGQLISLNLADFAPGILLVGVAMYMFLKGEKVQGTGQILAGFGMLFVGLSMMSRSMSGLKDIPAVLNILQNLSDPFLSILIGMIFTGIIQSVSASVGILQVMVQEGLMPFEGCVYLILGMNIGACVTALLASIGTKREAKQAAMTHLLFNVLGALVMTLILKTTPLISWIAMTSESGLSQVANANTIFKVLMVLIALPFSNQLVKLASYTVPKKDKTREDMVLHFLDERSLDNPPIAVAQATREVERMAEYSVSAVRDAMQAFYTGDKTLCQDVERREDIIDFLNDETTHYIIRINQTRLSSGDAAILGTYFHVINDLERIGDHAMNLVDATRSRVNDNLNFSDSAIAELREMEARVTEILDLSVSIFSSRNRNETLKVASLEQSIDLRIKELRTNHIERLRNQLCMPASGVLFIDILSNFERIADHATNIAYSVIDE